MAEQTETGRGPLMRDVTPTDRFRIHARIDAARRHNCGKLDPVTRVLNAATYVESFPHSYDAATVDAARRIHVYDPASVEWDAAVCELARLRGFDFPALHRPGA